MRRWGPGSGLGLLITGALLSSCSRSEDSQPQKAAAKPQVASSSAPAPAIGPSSLPAVSSAVPADSLLPESGAPEPAVAAAPSGPPLSTDQTTLAQSINQASPIPAAKSAGPAKPSSRKRAGASDPVLIRAEALLDRAGFSPGAIDGKDGENLQHALAAYAQAHGAASTTPAKSGSVDEAVWTALAAADAAPAVQGYQITDADVAGPFIGKPPTDYRQLAALPALAYSGPDQLLSEKFHMDPALLRALNPGADFSKAGAVILVVAPRDGPRAFKAKRIEVDKTLEVVRVFDDAGQLAAFYPASVGSTERPAPSGTFAVQAVSPRPAYYYDPARLTFAPAGVKGKLRIAPGPNNPVGSTWISLTLPTYGIHGAPDPTLIGKRQSHGCVRLTNWDAVELGKAVKKGVEVDFLGQEQAKETRGSGARVGRKAGRRA